MATDPDDSSHNSPNKRIKTLIPISDSPPQSQPSYISKGKIKIEEGTSRPIQEVVENESTDCCGICLSEAGNGGVSRGFIDSCNHYFCFVCIMEWAKVESKCPLCKRRFSTIHRPPKPPIFASERVVRVPVRDQVYHLSGNATIGHPDLYSESKCSVCHGTADESLLLLCDLCDSAAHTYCVGLGATVPEGDWFCEDCILLKDEYHLHSETSSDDSEDQIGFDTVHQIPSANENVSVFDIVREPSSCRSVQRSRSAASNPCSTNDETSMINNRDISSSAGLKIDSQHPTKPNARTLRHCRSLHDRIRVLRENWNDFRSGSMCFFSSAGDDNISNQKSMTSKTKWESVSCLNQQSTAQCSSFDMTNNNGTHEIDKAWKMLDKTISIKKGRVGSRSVRTGSIPTRKLNISTDSLQNGSKNAGNTRPGHHYYYGSFGKDYYKQPCSTSRKQMSRRHMTEDVTNASVRSGETLPAAKLFKNPACLSSSDVPESVVLNIDIVEGVNHTSSSHSKGKHPKEKSKLEEICVDSQQYNDAKSEIQSLVKLNLKLQTKEEKLEVDAFKEVARLATHSILAACGMEHPKAGYCSIPGFTCSHPNEVQQLQKSSLMPNSCRECFYVFVMDIVNTSLLQRKLTYKKT